MRLAKRTMKDTSDPNYELRARLVKQFEDEYGEDWDGTMVEYNNDFVGLPFYAFKAAYKGNIRTALQWLGKGDIKERVNAKCEDAGNAGLLYVAATTNQYDFMSYLLLHGVDVNILESTGASVLAIVCSDDDNLEIISLLLSWGAELFEDGKQMSKEEKLIMCLSISRGGNTSTAVRVSPELGGRRCEIVSTPNTRVDLVGKTCVVDEYTTESEQYKVTMEFTNEVLLLGTDNLKWRDRTPPDPGYYVECKNNRLICRDFESNEECQAFVAQRG